MIRLSEVLEGLRADDDMRKIAAVGGPTEMSSEIARTQGGTKEDQKAQIATKLMEIAGAQVASAAAAGSVPTNIVQQPPAGEKVTPGSVHVASANEVGDVVGLALEKLDEEGRKVASKLIIEKIAAMGVWKDASEIKVEKTAAKVGEDYEMAGRLMARGYHDELSKLAEADVKAIEESEKAATEKAATEKVAAEKVAGAEKTAAAGDDVQKLLDLLLK